MYKFIKFNFKYNVFIILAIVITVDLNEESLALENWNRKKPRKSKSYLVPNPHLRYLDISYSRSMKSLPILKNGSRFEELKSSKTKNIQGKVIFSNTCAIDSITSILMSFLEYVDFKIRSIKTISVSYCDSQNYSKIIDSIDSDYFCFISSIVKNGITSATYTT
ncbi:Uncharacterized protein FWK35_00018773 [Aphis craccivora]|uniref:Uncharacterized protein n=1 Tax=Aphis craccivora TaxID=307492 RepID=A0A6G0W1E9_APHCR|nr:Uncharacterized protein FWK35_00018773 [Aphis craccivora]